MDTQTRKLMEKISQIDKVQTEAIEMLAKRIVALEKGMAVICDVPKDIDKIAATAPFIEVSEAGIPEKPIESSKPRKPRVSKKVKES